MVLVPVSGWAGGGAWYWDSNAKTSPQLGCCLSWGLAWAGLGNNLKVEKFIRFRYENNDQLRIKRKVKITVS